MRNIKKTAGTNTATKFKDNCVNKFKMFLPEICAILLFLVIFPLSSQISFMQNDDWVYYKMVRNFLSGNFALDPISAPTFYTQGFLGALFSLVFSVNKLPILTLITSVLNFYVFAKTINKLTKLSTLWSVLISLLLFLNPLHIYSIWGFMTENYFLLFLLLSLYFFLNFEKTKNSKYQAVMYVCIVLMFLVRQVALAFPLALAVYYGLKKNFKLSAINFGVFALIYLLYISVFPQTPEMYEKGLQFHHFLERRYVYAIYYGSGVVLSAFLLPLFFTVINFKTLAVNKTKAVIFAGLTVFLYFILNRLFHPMEVSWGEFPYFENILERFGFYPRGVIGTKYHFLGFYDLYKYWDTIAKILLAAIISFYAVFIKKIRSFYLVFTAGYLTLMVVTETFYDRYLLVLIPIIILFVLENVEKFRWFHKIVISGFVMFLAFYTYQFSIDFILVNKYIWEKSEDLVTQLNVPAEKIHGTNAWKLNYPNPTGNYLYKFSYDSQTVNPNYQNYELIEEHKIDFPLNIFVKPQIYLYKDRE